MPPKMLKNNGSRMVLDILMWRLRRRPRCPRVPPKADLAAEEAEEEWLPQRSLGGTPAGSRRYVLLVGHPDVEVDPEVEKKAAMSQSAAEG